MCTIKNSFCDYIFINCFISLICMQNIIDFHRLYLRFLAFLKENVKKCVSIQVLKSVIICSLLINSTHTFDSLFNICHILLNQLKI